MNDSDIVIKGAREHNLVGLDLKLPRNQLICLTGVSGSGKSSLAFDTLYAEGQRRYVESLSTFARQFLGQMPKPDVDLISGLSPSISISQKSTSGNPRSTVGTITEIYDFLRVLFARVGTSHCPECGEAIVAQTGEQIAARLSDLPSGTQFSLLAPVVRQQKGEHRDRLADLLKQGFVRARVNGEIMSLAEDPQLDRNMRHQIDVVVDRIKIKKKVQARIAESVELALKLGQGTLIALVEEEAGLREWILSAAYSCPGCGIGFEAPTPQLFSFNSPQGMCPTCDGLGNRHSFDPELLIASESLSFKQGCFQHLGKWKDLGRWKRHLFQGVADTMERVHEWEAGTMLGSAWGELPEPARQIWLYGAGKTHITYTWRGGQSPVKYGGTFEGLVPELEAKYKGSKSRIHRRKLENYMDTILCPDCNGERLNAQARSIRIASEHPTFADAPSKNLPEVCGLSIGQARDFFNSLRLNEIQQAIAGEAVKEIRGRLGFLVDVGLDYLTLDRTAPTLSGGESQRIRLASQVGCGLVGVLYILDEPSIGLHPRDNDRLIGTLAHLRDQGNTVIVVEHDEDTMWASDHVVDFGPGPGVRGGKVVAAGSPDQVAKSRKSVTGAFLSGREKIEIPRERRSPSEKRLRIEGAEHNNLKGIDVEIPLGAFVCVTGVSGSGKSSLVNDIVVEALRRDLNRGEGHPGRHREIQGLEELDKLIAIDQSPIGRTPRSNPGTYIKVFDDIRKVFAKLPLAKQRGYAAGRFSFNVDGGRCSACEGNGSTKLEMDFLADVWVTCPICEGHRFNRETLQVQFKGHSIADVLEMDVQQAMKLFENIPSIQHKLQTLHDVGLDYIKIGQPSPTLSGGEAQRIKLAKELVKKSTGQTLYLLDEPTTGLHFADIQLLLNVLHGFVEAGNTVLVVEHNLDVIKTADWIIDLGPEGGAGGGELVAIGTPEEVARNRRSHTGKALAKILKKSSTQRSGSSSYAKTRGGTKSKPNSQKLRVRGAKEHNLKNIDVDVKRDSLTVFCGPSGSGKSSLAMDTIYAEGQRRYVESLSAYARQFVNQMQKPRLESIEGLSPAIAIEQKNLGNTPRSTVGTVTEVYDYLRILMARLGTPFCPTCDIPIGTQTVDEIVDKILARPEGERFVLLAPLDTETISDVGQLWEELRGQGFQRVRLDGETYSIDEAPKFDRRRRHQLQLVIDRLQVQASQRSRLSESVETALSFGRGLLQVAFPDKDVPEPRWEVVRHSQFLACDVCGTSYETLGPQNFSFNSPLGWCADCEGLGTHLGANPTALIRDGKLSLREGAVLLWPDLKHPISSRMLEALSAETGLPLDVPFDDLSVRWRRIVFHGTGDRWIAVTHGKQVLFEFQFKGVYPSLDEAAKLSVSFRNRLESFVDEVECPSCSGARLRPDAAAVQLQGTTLDEFCRMPLRELLETVKAWKFNRREKKIAGEVIREIENRLKFLNDVGLDYLALSRGAATLSNGEAQRIRLASQLGSGLCGVLYVLDEPTVGLHPRDNRRLIGAMKRLRDLGNTLLVVEHERDLLEDADELVDFGPLAGRLGGSVVAQAVPEKLGRKRSSVTGPYLSGQKAISIPSNRREVRWDKNDSELSSDDEGDVANSRDVKPTKYIEVVGARHHNLRELSVRFPLSTLTAVTGPSGCGKSTLIEDVLFKSLAKTLHRASAIPGAHDEIRGIEHINKVIRVDQQPLGNSPTSNPATYTGVFELIRMLFAQLPDSKLRGYTARRFSFNVPGGRCETCEGHGHRRIEMHFLPDVWVKCEACQGKRYNAETLTVHFHGHSISDVLELSCGQAAKLFENIPKVRKILQTLCDVGLDYVTLGQAAPTLSGGEAQRVKLAAELSRPDTGRTLYLLDEPTSGLHFEDLQKLLVVLHRLVDLGNTVVLIEHNLDVIKSCDWVIELGPEAGDEGGTLVCAGTPEEIVAYAKRNKVQPKKQAKQPRCHTGEALAPVLKFGPYEPRVAFNAEEAIEKEIGIDITELGKNVKMPWEEDGRKWHTRDCLDRKGEPVRWEGRILEEVVDRIQDSGGFSETHWNSRSVVEIASQKSSDGWFFHAITAESYLLKMKFRVPRGTFNRQKLMEQIPLKTANQRDDLPVYGNEPRVKAKLVRGPWQEVEIRAHDWAEMDQEGFWKFLNDAKNAFLEERVYKPLNIEDQMPWKKMGRKWHLSRKGFPPGKKPKWDLELLDELLDMLMEIQPAGQFLWNQQVLIHFMIPGMKEPWATITTKKTDHVGLSLRSPTGAVSLGRIAELGADQKIELDKDGWDILRIELRTVEEIHLPDFQIFLTELMELIQSRNPT
ncbi:MAG: excinuclease ABC subunit UvrA [Planctomycetota bacterium]|nr:excinuclease ABC subunit UvrA [Planctomycetota bacterium]